MKLKELERLKAELVSIRSTWVEEIKIRDDMLQDASRQCDEQQDKIESLELEIRAARNILETYGYTKGLTHDFKKPTICRSYYCNNIAISDDFDLCYGCSSSSMQKPHKTMVEDETDKAWMNGFRYAIDYLKAFIKC